MRQKVNGLKIVISNNVKVVVVITVLAVCAGAYLPLHASSAAARPTLQQKGQKLESKPKTASAVKPQPPVPAATTPVAPSATTIPATSSSIPASASIPKSPPEAVPVQTGPSIASQCSTELGLQDAGYNGSVVTVHQAFDPTIQTNIAAYDSLAAGGESNSPAAAKDIAQINTAYQNANSTLNAVYEHYVGLVSSFQPTGGSAGDCKPDVAQVANYPSSFTL